MDYASALLKGRGAAPPAASVSPPKPISRPAPAPIAPPKTSAAASPVKSVAVPASDPVEAAGEFGRLPVPVLVRIAAAAGPQGVCNLSVSSRYLFDKVLNAAWKQVQNDLPKTKKPTIKVRLDYNGTSADVEDTEDTAEIKAEGKILSLPLSQFQRDGQRMKLVSYWLDLVAHVQNERNAAVNKTDLAKDPLASRRGELQVTLGGGFTIDQAGKQRAKRLYTSSSLADVHTWLEAALALLQGRLDQTLKLDNTTVVLQRIGRGGSLLVVKNGDQKVVFDLADFVLELRTAAKEFLPFVGRCIVTLKNGVKQFQQGDQMEQYIERENVIKGVLKHQGLDRALKSLKHLLEVGAVPNSNLPQIFAKKRSEKMRAQSQAFIEYDNMWDFILENLPSDYEAAKEQAVRLNENAQKEREEARTKADEARQKAFEERKAKEGNKGKKGEEKAEEKAQEAKKDKKVEVKTVDKHGWVTRETQTVKADGSVVKPAAAASSAPAEPQQAQEKGGNKGKKGKQNQQNQNQNQGKKETKPDAKAAAAKAVEEASKEYLDSNPYAAVLREGSYQSAQDAQLKRVEKTAAPQKQNTPQKKNPEQKQGQKAGKKPEKKAAPAQQKKAAQAGQKDAKKAMKASAKPAQTGTDWVAPVAVVATVVVVLAVGYSFFIGA